MAYAQRGGLGLATVALSVPQLISAITKLFTGSSYDATHQQITNWTTVVANDPHLSGSSAQIAFENLRCWAGDQTVITPQNSARLFGGGNPAQGCGCEVSHGCRADAQTAIAGLKSQFPWLETGPLSSSAWTSPSGQSVTPTSDGSGVISVGTSPYTGVPYVGVTGYPTRPNSSALLLLGVLVLVAAASGQRSA